MQDYSTTYKHRKIPIVELKKKSHIEPERIIEFCKNCPVYGTSWSCPPFSFSVDDYWNKYKSLNLIAVKISYSDALRALPLKKQTEIGKLIIEKEKLRVLDELYGIEKIVVGSRALSAGTCDFCKLEGGCLKPQGKPCRHPGEMRYSIEALGGNLVSMLNEYFDMQFQWTTDGSLPEYHIIVFGVLES